MLKKMENLLEKSGVNKQEMKCFFRESVVNILGRENIANEIQDISGVTIDPLDVVYLLDFIYDNE